MSSKIRVLSEHTINKIAAGEVIENPSSVVKELVENALDAQSSEISVEIRGGGRQLIRVTDNGCGMSNDDALLCLERHATSKLKEVDDLWSIDTMGFRGEALPSIAAISKFTLLTSPRSQSSDSEGQEGTMVAVEGGKLLNCCPVKCSLGTTVEVKSLFFNIAVRKKFQRSPVYDTGEIQRVVTLQAIANPTVKFTLISNGELLFTTQLLPEEAPFSELLGLRISQLLGEQFFKQLCYLEGEVERCRLRGFIAMPNFNKHNRSEQYLLINRRALVSPLLSYFVREGYGTALPSGRHPIFVLHFEMPAGWLDVNVHPQKREVRLRREQQLKELIRTSIERTLQKRAFAETLPVPEPLQVDAGQYGGNGANRSGNFLFSAAEPFSMTPSLRPEMLFRPEEDLKGGDEQLYRPSEHQSEMMQGVSHSHRASENSDSEPTLFPEARQSTPKPAVVATISRYLIAKTPPQSNAEAALLWIVDQSSAHERIIFEQLKGKRNEKIEAQSLLLPYTLEFVPAVALLLRSRLSLLERYGIHIKEFSANTFVVDALPSLFGNVDIQRFIDGIIEKLSFDGADEPLAEECERKLATIASRSAISRERTLTLSEGEALLKNLLACDFPYQCPLGRPTIAPLTAEKIAALFS